jgi:hypothetical protein
MFLGFIFSVFRASLKMWKSADPRWSPLGAAIFILILNHSVVSITSNYFLRENVMVLWLVVILTIEVWHKQKESLLAAGQADSAPPITS